LTNGERGLELVQILEASSESLRQGGSAVTLNARTSHHHSARALHTNGENGRTKNGKYHIPVTTVQEQRVTL
jgi:hypothetical protein